MLTKQAVRKSLPGVLGDLAVKPHRPKSDRLSGHGGGAIETDFGGGTVRDNPDYNRFIASATVMGRAGLLDDVGPMIASVLSDDNRWVTGQRIDQQSQDWRRLG